mmetsp:Transcript_26708/g.32391  ORF Transcript_26708/g.32391 Transcript_26708/m.32391 type:complete len:533 (-) Transcript_26708:89-1687(-)
MTLPYPNDELTTALTSKRRTMKNNSVVVSIYLCVMLFAVVTNSLVMNGWQWRARGRATAVGGRGEIPSRRGDGAAFLPVPLLSMRRSCTNEIRVANDLLPPRVKCPRGRSDTFDPIVPFSYRTSSLRMTKKSEDDGATTPAGRGDDDDDDEASDKKKKNWIKRVFQRSASKKENTETDVTATKSKKQKQLERSKGASSFKGAFASALGVGRSNRTDDKVIKPEINKDSVGDGYDDKALEMVSGEEGILKLNQEFDNINKSPDSSSSQQRRVPSDLEKERQRREAALEIKRRKQERDEMKRAQAERIRQQSERLEREKAVKQAAGEKTNEKKWTMPFLSSSDDKERRDEMASGRPPTKKGGKKWKIPFTSSSPPSEQNPNQLNTAQSAISNVWDSISSSISKKQEEWIVVGPKTIISPGLIVPVTAAGLSLLLVASKDGTKLHCIANSCPHLGTPLETGTLEKRPKCDSECIVCPTHKTAFSLESGEVKGEWCPYPPVIGTMMGNIKPKARLPTFEVRARGKNIEVRINSSVI